MANKIFSGFVPPPNPAGGGTVSRRVEDPPPPQQFEEAEDHEEHQDSGDYEDDEFDRDLDGEEGDLELPDTGSLVGISINRNREGVASPAVQPARAMAQAEQRLPRTLAEYWSQLRRGRRWPQRSDVDPKQIGAQWPDTRLMRCATGDQQWQFESLYSQVVRGGGQNVASGAVDFTPMVMEWILTMGREAESSGSPVEELDVFPTPMGKDVRYKAVAVPLSDDDETVNYVMCHVERV